MFPIRQICLLVAALFFITVLISLSFSIHSVVTTKTRGGPINLGFNALYLLVVLPYALGVITGTCELMVLFMLCCGHSVILNFTLAFINTGVPFAVFIVNVIVHIPCLIFAFIYWKQLRQFEGGKLPPELILEWSYAIRRFGNYI